MDRSERMGLRFWVVALVLSALFVPCGLSAQATMEPSPRLTDRGHWLIAGSAGGSYADGARTGLGMSWFVRVAPEATFFVRDRIGVGLALHGGVGEGTAAYYTLRNSEFGGGVTGTFEVPLSSRLGILFRPFLGYVHQWRRITAGGGLFGLGAETSAPGALIQQQAAFADALRTQELGSLRASLAMELLVHLSPHVGLAAGPQVWFDWLFEDGERAAWSQALRQRPEYYPGDEPSTASQPQPVKPYRVQVGLSVSLLFGI
jgi:hypothetical protein